MLRKYLLDLANASPGISAHELASAFVQQLDHVFTRALAMADLPETPSSLQRRLAEYQLQRMPARSRDVRRAQWRETDILLEALWNLKSALDGQDVSGNDFDGKAFVPDANDPQSLTRIRSGMEPTRESGQREVLHVQPGMTGLRMDISSFVEAPDATQLTAEMLADHEEVTRVPFAEPGVRLTDEAKRELQENPALPEIVNRVEKTARRFHSLIPPQGNVVVDWIQDIEWPAWEKLAVELNPRKLSFEDRLSLWESFDKALQEEIQEAIRLALRQDKVRLRRMRERVFVHMQLY